MLPTDRPLTSACQSFTMKGSMSTIRMWHGVRRPASVPLTRPAIRICRARASSGHQSLWLFRAHKLAVVPHGQEPGVGTERLVVCRGEGMPVHLCHRLGEVVDFLEGITNLLRIRADL